MKARVIGAGIGGLTAAIALRKAGIETIVFERARELKEIGAGISLAPNATKAFKGLGLADALGGIGAPIKVAEIRTWQGEVLSRIPVWQLDEKVGAPTLAVHRADLQGRLLQELGEGAVRLGTACMGFEQGDGGVRAFFTKRRRASRSPCGRRRASLDNPPRALGRRGCSTLRRLHSLARRCHPRGRARTGVRGFGGLGYRSEVHLHPDRPGNGVLGRQQERTGR